LLEIQLGKCGYNLLRFEAHVDVGEQEVEDIARLILPTIPEVRGVFDATLIVGRNGITLHNPLDGTFAIAHCFKQFGKIGII
jgi:hypothetical protein